MQLRIIGVGDLTVDHILPGLLREPRWGQELEISAPTCRLGGNIGNMLRGLKSIKSDFICFGGIGDDGQGDYIRSQLRELDLSEEGLHCIEGESTSQSFAGVRTDGERFFLTYAGVLKQTEKLLKQFELPPGKIVFLSGWCLPPRVDKDILIEKVLEWKQQGRWIAMDLFWSDETWKACDDLIDILKHLDALFLNEDELYALTKAETLKDGVQVLKRLAALEASDHRELIIKRGKKGAMLITSEDELQYAAPPENLDNTVGAGDLFNLAYIHAKWKLKLNPTDILRFACTFVPKFLQRENSDPPDENEIVQFLSNQNTEGKEVIS